MNTKPSSNRTTIIVIIAVILLGVGYFWYSGNKTPVTSSLASTDNIAVGAQVLNLLNQIQNLRIDTALFNDPAYTTLRDFSVLIPPLNVGRPNPFAPLPGYQSTGGANR